MRMQKDKGIFERYERVLAVAAHPDDEVIGCGGTLARLIDEGKEVHVLILGGVTSSREKTSNLDDLTKEAEQAAGVMGITSLVRTGFDDNRFDKYSLLEIIKEVEKVKMKIQPDLVLCHDFSDLNIDHRIAHQATITAFRPLVKQPVKIMAFEILSSTGYQDQAMTQFTPNCYVDISDFLSQKIRAMECYKSELMDFPHPRSSDGIRCLAKKRGMDAGLVSAEAFRIVREIL